MKHEVRGFQSQDMPREKRHSHTLVTKNPSRMGFGYDLTFIEPQNAFLVSNPKRRWHEDDRTLPYFIDYPRLVNEEWNKFDLEDLKRPLLRVSDVGLTLIHSVGIEQFWKNMDKPEAWGGEVIGRGKESEIKKVTIGDQVCALRTPNDVVQRLNAQTSYRITYSGAHYEYYFGTTMLVGEILGSVHDHFHSFKLAQSPIDYVAGQRFKLEEYQDNIGTVWDIRSLVKDEEKEADMLLFGKNKQHWSLWYAAFAKEVERIEEVFYFRELEQQRVKGINARTLFAEIDLHPANWLIKQIDPESGIPTVSLIDQNDPRPTPQGGMWDLDIMDRARDYDQLGIKYRTDPLLHELQALDV